MQKDARFVQDDGAGQDQCPELAALPRGSSTTPTRFGSRGQDDKDGKATPAMTDYQTKFGALSDFDKGRVEIVDDDPKNYVFSNVFDVASKASAYERVAVAKNFEYVIEAVRAEGTSGWYAADHDEFVLCMDGQIEVHLVRLDKPAVEAGAQGAVALADMPEGRKMGRLVLSRGHMGLLPKGAAYRFHAEQPAAMMIQTIEGPVTVEKWADICQTAA